VGCEYSFFIFTIGVIDMRELRYDETEDPYMAEECDSPYDSEEDCGDGVCSGGEDSDGGDDSEDECEEEDDEE